MTDTENTEPAARSGPTLAVLAQELGVSMRQAVALVTRAGEPLHQIWCGPEPISPEIADLARRLHRDTDPERPLFGVPPGVLARELDVAPEWLDGYVSSLLEEGRLVVWTDRGVLSAAAADEIRTLVRAERVPVTDQERVSRLYAVGGRVEALLHSSGRFWVEAKEVDGGDTWRADVSDKVTGAWFTLTVQDLETSVPVRPPEVPPQGITVRDLALELHQPVSLTIAQVSAYSAAVRLDPYQERATWIGDWVLTPRAAQWIRRPLRESEPSPTAGFTSYYGPTAWDGDAGKLWHRDCPNAWDSGRDGEVWLWKDGGETCLDCGQGPDPEPSPAQLPARGPCSVLGQPREAAQAASPDPEDVAEMLIRQDMALSAVDDGPERIPEDTAVLEWAVRTAGHRFDPHTLWDYDLLTDDQHVHRCLDHRHTGPNTRGPVRRGQ